MILFIFELTFAISVTGMVLKCKPRLGDTKSYTVTTATSGLGSGPGHLPNKKKKKIIFSAACPQ